MPPVRCHLNGGVNLASSREVLETVATTLRGRVRRITDGEVGDGQQAVNAGEPRRGARQQWIWFLIPAFERADGLKEVEPALLWGDEFPQFRIIGDPQDVRFDGLGYADAYEASYREFLGLRERGVIEDGVRFQAQFPTPLAAAFWLVPQDQERGLPAVADAVFAEVRDFLARVDPGLVAIQWDVAVEFGLIEGWFGPKVPIPIVADGVAQAVNSVPADVPCGVHLCYGDYRHRHLSEPASIGPQVELVDALNARLRRSLDFVAFTVPQYQAGEEWFEPLRGLRTRGDTELYFALVPYHPDEQGAGTTERQVELIDRFLVARPNGDKLEWGVCTECGMARAERQDVTRLLELHREIVERFGAARTESVVVA